MNSRAVVLWVAQSLLGAAAVILWIAAVHRAKRDGMSFFARWLFPWSRVWRAGARALPVAWGASVALYAISWWLARGA